MNRVIEDLEYFLEKEFKRLTKDIPPNAEPEKYFIAELVLIQARLKSLMVKYGYEK